MKKGEQNRVEFARLVAAGVSKKDAYRQAYHKPDMSDDAASKAAWRLSRKEEVLKKVSGLMKAADRGAVMSRRERMEELSRSAKVCAADGDVSGMVKCIAELNRMDGAYEPERVEVQSDLSVAALLAEIAGN